LREPTTAELVSFGFEHSTTLWSIYPSLGGLMKKLLVFTFSLIVSEIPLASASELPSCSSVDLHAQSDGFRCESALSGSPNRIFKRVNLPNFVEAWQRESDGTIWATKVLSGNSIDPSEAESICDQLGVRLPSADDFIRNNTSWRIEGGVRMALSIHSGHFWTSSKTPSGTPLFVNGWSGHLEEWEGYRISPEDVICVR
jgi:hypothetical protein